MKTSLEQSSAQIIQFPAGGRAGKNTKTEAERRAAEAAAWPKIAVGGSWYHDAAIDEDKG